MELVFFSCLYSVWSALLCVLIRRRLICIAFNVVLGTTIFHGEIEPRVARHRSIRVKETLGGLLLIVALVRGYLN